MSKTLYVFVDESGNFDFSPKGTKYFVMSAVYTTSPEISARAMLALKYKLLGKGIDVASFHATNDSQNVRNLVFSTIRNLQNFGALILFSRKNELPTNLKDPASVFKLFSKNLIFLICEEIEEHEFTSIVFVFDQALPRKILNQILKSLKPELKTSLIKYSIYFHSMSSDPNGQIADYICWANYVFFERNEKRPLENLGVFHDNDRINILKFLWKMTTPPSLSAEPRGSYQRGGTFA